MGQELKNISCCLITKDPVYPAAILDRLMKLPFGEFLILTNSDSPYRKHELFAKAKHDWIYYQDDDALCPAEELVKEAEPTLITLAQKQGHQDAYRNRRFGVGFGWGCFFQKRVLSVLKKYTDVYGEDDVYKRETERIVMFFNYPQNRLVLPIIDLPSAYAEDRLWRQPHHQDYAMLAEQRCAKILSDEENRTPRSSDEVCTR